MKNTYWEKALILLCTFFTCTAFILTVVALRKYGSDITQIPSKLRISVVTINLTHIIAILVCGLYILFKTTGKYKNIKCMLILIGFAMVNIWVSSIILTGDYPYIKSIDLMHLDEVSDGILASEDLTDYDGIYYIGRRDCFPCQTFYRTLQNLTEKYCAHVFYYDTFEDRQNNADNMYRILAKLSVDTVPLVFTVQEGEVTNIFVGDSIEIDLRNFLANC